MRVQKKNVSLLAEKVINGGVGVWGEVPMPAHPGLSEEDAKDMVRYVLLFEKIIDHAANQIPTSSRTSNGLGMQLPKWRYSVRGNHDRNKYSR